MDSDGDGPTSPSTAPNGWPNPPLFSFSQHTPPRVAAEILASDFLPSSTSKGKEREVKPSQRFWRRARWSPDGTHLLAQTEAHQLDLFALVPRSPAVEGSSAAPPLPLERLQHVFRITSPTTVLDYAWYPYARYDDPTCWCFLYSAPSIPAKLIDAYRGTVRASYGIENHVEQFLGPQALGFSLDGSSLYCGVRTSLACFAMVRPGTNTCSVLPLLPSRGAHGEIYQRGPISSLAVGPAYTSSSVSGDLIAVGTFAGTVGIYQRPGEALAGQWTESPGSTTTAAHDLCTAGWIEKDGSGITQLQFHPAIPYLLFVSLRRSPLIKCYDLRYISSVPNFTQPSSDSVLIALFERSNDPSAGTTNQQRLFFDVDWAGRWLIAGNSRGVVRIWSISEDDMGGHMGKCEASDKVRPPQTDWTLQSDSISSITFHPLKPLLLSTTGCRRWGASGVASLSDQSNGSDSDSTTASDDEGQRPQLRDSPALRSKRKQLQRTSDCMNTWVANDARMTLWDAS